ncbi:related to cytidylyltransferase family protein [Phialocephala subalpina]|uniref:Related to cytidylyltransferase family protein n=1 Tax=Phialocephala subalpina TaxID=576137 RepID=A0A1L7X3H7_9HELO|nr:related to cytidylyltransferase family protein [Phialocephala subalpina]
MSTSSTPAPTTEMQQLRSALPTLTNFLHTFASSTSNFSLLTTITTSSAFPPSFAHPPTTLPTAPKTLYILDSSYNPPTLAHLRIATSALLHDTQPYTSPRRLLLLLATQNADKAPKPASFEHRLTMMTIFARDLLSSLPPPKESSKKELAIDIGVTKLPYFHDKASSIADSGIYPNETQQIHLLGYDTLTRLLSTKYYSPNNLSILAPFFSSHRVRVTYRPDSSTSYKSSREEQDRYINDLREGKKEEEGGRREWVTEGRIEMVEGRKEGEEVVSSTRVREAIKNGDRELLDKLVTSGVKEWVLREGLYLDD